MNNQAKIVLSAEDRTAAAFAAVSRNVDKLGFNLGTLKGLAGSALGALAVPVSAGAIVGLVNSAREAVDQLVDLSDASGSSVENISALDKIARATGGSIDIVSGTLIKFNAVLKEADPSKGPGAILKSLNLDIEELKRLDPAEALRLTAVALGNYADNGDKARAVQELFGKSVKEAGPFLKDLAEAGALNASVTTEQAAEVDKFNKQLALLQSNAVDVSRALSIDLITALNGVIAKFQQGTIEGKGFLSTAAGIYAQNVKDFYSGGQSKPGSRSASGSIVDLTSESSAESARLLRGAPPKPTLKVPETKPGGGGGRTGGRSGGGAARDPYAEANRYLEGLKKQVEAAEKLTATEKALRDLQLGRLGKVTPAQREAILEAAAAVDKSKELEQAERDRVDVLKDLRQATIDEMEALSARNDAYQAGIESMIAATPTMQLEKQRDVMADLAAEYEKGRFGAVGSADAVALYGETVNTYLGNLPDVIEKSNNAMQELGATFASAFEDAIISGASLKDVLKGLEQDIMRIITRKLVTEPLANFVTGAIKSFVPFEDGGIMTPAGPLPLKSYARGGIANSPQLALYGEGSMNEAYVPLPDGRRIPVALEGGRGGGGGSVVNHIYTVNVTPPAGASRASAQQWGAAASRELSRASQRSN